MRTITLTEYEEKLAVQLSVEERDLLGAIAPGITISPSTGMVDHYDLKPDSHVGAITLPDLVIEIRPKVQTLTRVLFLMSYALNPNKWQETLFEFPEAEGLHEAIVPVS